MTGHPKWRRRKFLVDRRLQHRFIWLLSLQVGVIVFVIGFFTFRQMMSTRRLAEEAFQNAEVQLEVLNRILDRTQQYMLHTLILIVVIAVALYAIGIFASHKIAGPIFKLKKYLTAIQHGDLSGKIAFRKKDQLDDFALVLNETFDSLLRRENRARNHLQSIAAASEEFSKVLDPRDINKESVESYLRSVKENLERLEECI
jgi:methyl-accepting chemotaxis protein